MSNILEINEDTFENEVLQAETPVVVDFSAVWCGPCKMLDPVVEELASDWDGQVKFVKLDVDHSPSIAMNYAVMGVPTLMLFKGGEVQERLSGYMPKNKIVSKLSPHL
jgi:thioredoxin 1